MSKILSLIAILVIFAVPSFATTLTPSCSASSLAAGTCGGTVLGNIATVVDAANASTCTTDGGDAQHLCVRINHAWIPAGGGASGGGGVTACSSGTVKGFGYDAVTNEYDATCGNYPWSAEYGGTVAGVSSYDTPTKVGGNTEIATCTGSGRATTAAMPGGYTEEACYEAGQRVYKNALADLQLAHDFTKKGGKIYVPEGTYELAGCGARSDGTKNNCPVLRYPDNGHYQRVLQAYGGRRFIGAGMDHDGPYAPLTSASKLSGTYFILNRGITGAVDKQDDTTVLDNWSIEVGTHATLWRLCDAASDALPECTVTNQNQAVGDNAWASAAAVVDEVVPWDGDSVGYVCTDNRLGTTGTCTGDRRVSCAGDSTCSDAGVGTCEGFVDAIWREAGVLQRDIFIKISGGTCNDDESDCTTAGFSGFVAMFNPEGFRGNNGPWACGPGNIGKWINIAIPNSMPQAYIAESQHIPVDSGVHVLSMDHYSNEGGGIEGVTVIHGSPRGRVATDVVASGVATTGSGANTLVTSEGGMATNQYQNMTLILEGGEAGQQVRKISSNTADTFTVASNWIAEAPPSERTNPVAGDTWRVSNVSCTTNEAPCDKGIVVSMGSGFKGSFTNNAFWYLDAEPFLIDGSAMAHKIEFNDNLVARMYSGNGTDASDWSFRRNVWLYNACQGGGSLLNLGFVGGSMVEDDLFVGNQCNLVNLTARGGSVTMNRVHAIGNIGAVILHSTRAATLFSDFTIIGNQGAIVKGLANNGDVTGESIFRSFRIYGQPPLNADSQFGQSFISYSSINGTYRGRFRHITFQDWHIRSVGGLKDCIVTLDYDRNKFAETATGGGPTGGATTLEDTTPPWGYNEANYYILYIRPGTATQEIRTITNSAGNVLTWVGALTTNVSPGDAYAIHEPLSEDIGQFTFRDMNLQEIGDYPKDAAAICIMDLDDRVNAKPNGCDGGGGAWTDACNKDDDLGIWSAQNTPIIDNVRINGIPVASNEVSGVFAAQAPVCVLAPDATNEVGPGGIVRIIDDSTNGACLDTVGGVLDGGGAGRSTCACRNASGAPAYNPQ